VLLNLVLAASTALLLILTFPKFDFAFLAAFALTPLLVAVGRGASRAPRHFLLGWVAGILYWAGAC